MKKIFTLISMLWAITAIMSAQDTSFTFSSATTFPIVINSGSEFECDLSTEGTITLSTDNVATSANPSYVVVSLPNAASTTLQSVSIEVLANNATAGKEGICAFSVDGSTWTNGAIFSLPVNTGPTQTYKYNAPVGALYFKAGRISSGSSNKLGNTYTNNGSATVKFYRVNVWLNKITTGINTATVDHGTVVKIEYFTISGAAAGSDANTLPNGIYIAKTTYSDGAVVSQKTMVKK